MSAEQRETQNQGDHALRVRRGVWAILLAAVLLAVSIPATNLWHASSVALNAHVYLSPAIPRAGEPTQLVIALAGPADRAAVEGPWAKAIARWDMLQMTMGTRQRAVPGAASKVEMLAIPLCLDMAGSWWAQIVIQAPGRPEWRSSLQFDVQPAQTSATLHGATSQATTPEGRCT